MLVVTAAVALTVSGCGGADIPLADNPGPTVSSSAQGAVVSTAPGAAVSTAPGAAVSTAPEQTEGPSAESQPPPAGGGAGTIVLNDESHAVEQVLRCTVDPDLKEGSLDLAAVSEGMNLQLLLNVEFREQLVAVEGDGMEPKVLQTQSVDLQGPAAGGLWGAIFAEAVIPPNFSPVWTDEDFEQVDGPPLTIAGDQMSGSLTLNDNSGGPGSVDLSFAISIPSQAIDCSL